MSFIIEPGDNPADPNSISRRRKIAEELMKRGSDTSPVQHWTQGAARLMDALNGVMDERRANADEKKQQAWETDFLGKAIGGAAPQASTGSPVVAALAGGGGSAPTGTFDDAVARVLKFEGGYTEDNGGPTNFGISSRANPDVDVKSLTADGAKAIYKQRYWDTIGGDALAAKDPRLAMVAFDTAVNAGPGRAKQLLAASGGDPQKLLALRQQFNDGLVAKDPDQYAKYQNGWNNRLASLGGMVGGGQPQPTAMGGQTANDGPQPGVPAAPGGMMGAAAQANAPAQALPPQMVAQAQQATQGMSVQQMMQAAQRMSPQGQAVMRMLIQQKVEQANKQTDPVYQSKVRMIPQQEQALALDIQEKRARLGLAPLNEEKLKLEIAKQAEDLKNAPIQREGLALSNDKARSDIANANETTATKEYRLAKSQGYPGTFEQYSLERSKAAAPSVNIDQKAEGAFEKTVAEGQAKLFNGMAEEGVSANAELAQVQALRQQMQNIPGGFMSAAQGLASQYGIKLGPNASSIEAAQAIISKLVPTQKAPGSGTISDADLALFKDSLPKLSNTPQGNALILDTMQGLSEYKAKQGEIATAVLTGEMSRKDAMKALRELPSPFANFKKIAGEQPKAKAEAGGPPPGVEPEVWKHMTPEERKLWN